MVIESMRDGGQGDGVVAGRWRFTGELRHGKFTRREWRIKCAKGQNENKVHIQEQGETVGGGE